MKKRVLIVYPDIDEIRLKRGFLASIVDMDTKKVIGEIGMEGNIKVDIEPNFNSKPKILAHIPKDIAKQRHIKSKPIKASYASFFAEYVNKNRIDLNWLKPILEEGESFDHYNIIDHIGGYFDIYNKEKTSLFVIGSESKAKSFTLTIYTSGQNSPHSENVFANIWERIELPKKFSRFQRKVDVLNLGSGEDRGVIVDACLFNDTLIVAFKVDKGILKKDRGCELWRLDLNSFKWIDTGIRTSSSDIVIRPHPSKKLYVIEGWKSIDTEKRMIAYIYTSDFTLEKTIDLTKILNDDLDYSLIGFQLLSGKGNVFFSDDFSSDLSKWDVLQGDGIMVNIQNGWLTIQGTASFSGDQAAAATLDEFAIGGVDKTFEVKVDTSFLIDNSTSFILLLDPFTMNPTSGAIINHFGIQTSIFPLDPQLGPDMSKVINLSSEGIYTIRINILQDKSIEVEVVETGDKRVLTNKLALNSVKFGIGAQGEMGGQIVDTRFDDVIIKAKGAGVGGATSLWMFGKKSTGGGFPDGVSSVNAIVELSDDTPTLIQTSFSKTIYSPVLKIGDWYYTISPDFGLKLERTQDFQVFEKVKDLATNAYGFFLADDTIILYEDNLANNRAFIMRLDTEEVQQARYSNFIDIPFISSKKPLEIGIHRRIEALSSSGVKVLRKKILNTEGSGSSVKEKEQVRMLIGKGLVRGEDIELELDPLVVNIELPEVPLGEETPEGLGKIVGYWYNGNMGIYIDTHFLFRTKFNPSFEAVD